MIILLKSGHVIVPMAVVYVQYMNTSTIILFSLQSILFELICIFRTEYYRSEQAVTKEVNVTIYHCCLGWTRLIHDYGCPIGKNSFNCNKKYLVFFCLKIIDYYRLYDFILSFNVLKMKEQQ